MCIYFSYLCSSVFIHKCWKPLNWQFIYIWVSCREPSKDTAAQTQSFLGPAEIVTQGSNWSKVSRFCWRSFFSCHICSFFFFLLYSSTGRNTLITAQSRSAASVPEWKALNLPFLQLQSPSHETDCCSERQRPVGSRTSANSRSLHSHYIFQNNLDKNSDAVVMSIIW